MQYRIQVLDEHNQVVASDFPYVTTLDDVIVLQMKEQMTPDAQERMMRVLRLAFKNRSIILLPPDVAFVRLVKE